MLTVRRTLLKTGMFSELGGGRGAGAQGPRAAVTPVGRQVGEASGRPRPRTGPEAWRLRSPSSAAHRGHKPVLREAPGFLLQMDVSRPAQKAAGLPPL